MFKRNSINVHSKRRKLVLQILGAYQNSELAGRWLRTFFNGFSKSVCASIVLNIEWTQFVLQYCEIQEKPAYENLGFKNLLR